MPPGVDGFSCHIRDERIGTSTVVNLVIMCILHGQLTVGRRSALASVMHDGV